MTFEEFLEEVTRQASDLPRTRLKEYWERERTDFDGLFEGFIEGHKRC